MVNIEAQFYSAMKNINYLTKLFMGFFCCVAKLTQEIYYFGGLLGGLVVCWLVGFFWFVCLF